MGGSGQDNVRFVWPECINSKLFGSGRLPQELPISPPLPEPSSPGPLSICAKFIRLPSVCVAIMAAPSCCSSKRAHGLQSLAQTLQRRVSVLSYWLWLTALFLKRPVAPSHLWISEPSISTSFIMFTVCLLNYMCQRERAFPVKSHTARFCIPLFFIAVKSTTKHICSLHS